MDDFKLTSPANYGQMRRHRCDVGPPVAERSYKARKKFLDALAKGYSISRAADEADRSVGAMRTWKREDPNFAQDWDDAIEAGTDRLEDRARDRAMRDSDQLMVVLLKARRPDKFRERTSVEHSGSVKLEGSRDKLRARLAALHERRGQGGVPQQPV